MPRTARERSTSGIYHIMLRGTNRQELFHDDEDNIRFLETLARYKQICKLNIYGWCLMDNHVHLLAGEGQEEISLTIKRIGISYAWYYNWKYQTIGHLFQDRYKSEKVEDDAYLIGVTRYIHQNPVKAGIVKEISEWRWSSFRWYLGNSNYLPNLLDSELILGMFAEDRETAMRLFKEHNEQKSEDCCLDDIKKTRLTDVQAGVQIKKLIQGYEIAEVKSLSREQRNGILRDIKQIEGITLRQAARIFGIPHTLVFKA